MARASKRSAKKSRVISLDFEGVEAGGGGFKIPEGEYRMKVLSVEDTESEKGNDMFKWTFEGLEKKAKGKKFFLYTVYDPPDSLWKLRSLLEALGQEVPDGALDLDLDEMVDLELVGIVGDEEYDGKTTSKLQDFSSGDEDGDGDDDEDDKKKSSKKKGSKKDAADDEDDGDKKKGKKKGKTKDLEAKSADEVKAMDEEEMEELVSTYELDVDLSEHKTPRRKASAIISALEEKELLSDD